MADDANTGLLVTIEARTAAFERAFQRIEKQTKQTFGAVKTSAATNIKALESTMARTAKFEAAFSRMDRSFANFGKSLLPSLSAISAALTVREITAYASAWVDAKNALAVAGVQGQKQADVLQKLFNLSQANAAPLEATVQLYGRASMAAENLGASQDDLLKLTDAVGLALKVSGQSATEASGGLLQLSQLLQGNMVQSQEYNSLVDSLYPLLQAVAAGSDRWGGSVAKLTADVKAGKVTVTEFFQAILKGSDTLRTKADAAVTTLGQAITRISNAMTKYVGETDESLGASQRLVAGLTALADDFDTTADTALKFVSVLGGAFIGRSIAGMLATIPQAASAVMALVTAMRAGTLTAAGFTAALGPIGLIAGAATAAYLAFGNWENSIDDATRALADQAQSGAAIEGMIADVAKAQDAYKSAIATTANVQTEASKSIVADTLKEFNAKKSLLELELKRQQALMAVQRAELGTKSAALKESVGDQVFTRNSAVERGFSDPRIGDFVRLPDDITGLEKTQAAIDASPITAEIKKIQAEMALTEISAGKLSEALNTTFSSGEGGGGVKSTDGGDTGKGKGKGKGGRGGGSSRLDEYERLAARIADATAATIAETEAQSALNPTMNDFGFAAEKARTEQELLAAALKAGKEVTPELRAEIQALAGTYAQAEADAARLKETQGQLRQAAEEWASTAKDATKGFVTDLLEGKSAAEAFSNVLKKLGDKLLDLAIDGLFNIGGTGGMGGGGGIFGAIFSGIGSLFGFKDGGCIGTAYFSHPPEVLQ